MEKTCVFCSVRDKPHEGVIAGSEHALALLDKHPLAPGHSLVVTRRHYDSLMGVPEEEMLDLFRLVVKLEKALIKSGFGEGVDLRQHFRPYLPESKYVVRHVHVHLLPRRPGDDIFTRVGKRESLLRSEPPFEELAKVAKRIGASMQ